MAEVRSGDIVRIRYTTKTEEGAVYETSGSRKPLRFIAGSDAVVRGVSQAVIGMSVGETKTVTLPPELAFGIRKPELERRVSRVSMPDVDEGDQLSAYFEDQKVDVWIQRLEGGKVVVDANHPLAGETLVYEIELVGVEPQDGETEGDQS